MANTFTKKDLKTGDIVVLRDRELGVVIAEKGVILFQNIGMGILDDYSEDLCMTNFSKSLKTTLWKWSGDGLTHRSVF